MSRHLEIFSRHCATKSLNLVKGSKAFAQQVGMGNHWTEDTVEDQRLARAIAEALIRRTGYSAGRGTLPDTVFKSALPRGGRQAVKRDAAPANTEAGTD